jgi:hypothetical protein
MSVRRAQVLEPASHMQILFLHFYISPIKLYTIDLSCIPLAIAIISARFRILSTDETANESSPHPRKQPSLPRLRARSTLLSTPV